MADDVEGRRDRASVEVLLGALPASLAGRRALAVGDPTGRLAVAARVRGAAVSEWTLRGPGAVPWPPEGEVDLAAVRLPREKTRLDLVLHALASRLVPAGELWIAGTNDEGIRSAVGRMAEVFDEVATVDTRRHCRVLRAVRPGRCPGLRSRLELWRQVHSLDLPSGARPWTSYPGTFARGGLDAGTALLLEALPALPGGARVLDFACGTGVIAAELLARSPSAAVDLLDHDALSLEAARDNVPSGRCFLGEGWPDLPEGDYDLVASNPPIHSGVERSYRVVDELLAGRRLASGGELWLVTLKAVPVPRLAPGAELRREDGRYRVWRVGRGAPRERVEKGR